MDRSHIYKRSQLKNNTQYTTLRQMFHTLPKSIQRNFGMVKFPPDNSIALLSIIQNESNTMYGASDASLKNGNAAHAWIISSGHPDDIKTPTQSIHGSSPVDGHSRDLSSCD